MLVRVCCMLCAWKWSEKPLKRSNNIDFGFEKLMDIAIDINKLDMTKLWHQIMLTVRAPRSFRHRLHLCSVLSTVLCLVLIYHSSWRVVFPCITYGSIRLWKLVWQRKKSSWKEQVDLRTKKLKEDATSATDDYLLKKKLQIEETKSHEETPEVKKPAQLLRRTLLL